MKELNHFALVTGGAKGIGCCISKHLAEAGWNLILSGRDMQVLEKVSHEIRMNYAVEVKLLVWDFSEKKSLHEILQTILKHWDIFPQVLVCNAADYGPLGPLAEIPFPKWKESFDLNFFSVVELIQSFLHMAQWRGSHHRKKIIIIGDDDLGEAQVWSGISAYSCAKAALYRLVEVLHEEFYSQGVDINYLTPGWVKTGMTDQALKAGEKALGALYTQNQKVYETGGISPHLAAEMVLRLIHPDMDGVSGRLIHANTDTLVLNHLSKMIQDPNLLRLRRIDNKNFQSIVQEKAP